MNLDQMSVREYLDVLASKKASPGGGSAAALSVAQGLGLILMVTNLTKGTKKYVEFDRECRDVNQKASNWYKNVIPLIDADAKAFEMVMDAYGTTDPVFIDMTLKKAAEIPFAVLEYALKGLKEAAKIKGRYNPNCITDYISGALCLAAGARMAYMNVEVNLRTLEDQREKIEEAKRMLEEAEKTAEAIYE